MCSFVECYRVHILLMICTGLSIYHLSCALTYVMRQSKYNTYAAIALILRTDRDPYGRAAVRGDSLWFGAV